MTVPYVKEITTTLALAATALGGSVTAAPPASAESFLKDSVMDGGIYYWQRERDRKDVGGTEKHQTNLSHSTWNAALNFSSGYAAGFAGFDVGAFAAVEMAESAESGHPNEIAFSSSNKAYDEKYDGDKSGVNLYKAAAKLKMGPTWARIGWLQPSGQTLLAPHWSFMPGTYQGFEAGAALDFKAGGALSFSYMWANRYKAPWHLEMDAFYQGGLGQNRGPKVSYLHSLGGKYDVKNGLTLEAAFGQAENFMDQYFAKGSYKFNVGSNALTTSYQFYGAHDHISDVNSNLNVYDGLVWLQGVTLGYKVGSFDINLEGTWVKANGPQGYFLQRMTPAYASSNGRLDVWWDNRSDFNADGEKAVFAGLTYDLGKWRLPGWSVGGSYVYGWDAKPSSNPLFDQRQRVKESAYSLDAKYVVQEGRAKGSQFKLHFTQYDNHSRNPSYSNGYGNMFQDEYDVKLIVVIPFTVF